MSKPRKADKVEEPASTYGMAPKVPPKTAATSQQNESAIAYVEREKARRLANRLFEERKDLLRRLAQ